jgi:hypothetical protein
VCRRDGRGEPSSSPGERASAETGGERGASVLAEASPAVAPGGGRSCASAAGPALRAASLADEGLGRPLPLCWMRPSRMFRSAALLLTDHSSRDSTGRLALEALKTFMSLTEAPAGSFTRCPLNLNSHNHNQHAGRPCFSLAVQIERSTSTLRYDISGLRNRSSHVSVHAILAHTDCPPLHRSTAVEPSGARCKQRARLAMRMTIGWHWA